VCGTVRGSSDRDTSAARPATLTIPRLRAGEIGSIVVATTCTGVHAPLALARCDPAVA
jgi:hypothetical protein